MANLQSETLEYAQRPSYISELVPASASIIKPLFDQFDPSQIDLDDISARARQDGGVDNGVQEIYYAGLFAWLKLRDKLEEIDLETPFQGAAREAIDNFTFRTHAGSVVDAQLQSSLSSPAIFSAWLGVHDHNISLKGIKWNVYNNVPRDDAIDILQSEWFPNLLRSASITNSGLYRNGTGFKLNYRRFVARSIHGPLKRYYAERPEGSFPVEADADEQDKIVDARLSKDFKEFLAERMRKHNIEVKHLATDEPLHEGTSRGCPFARTTHFVSDPSLVSDDIGHIEGLAADGEKTKIALDWDPYKQVSLLLANVLENLE